MKPLEDEPPGAPGPPGARGRAWATARAPLVLVLLGVLLRFVRLGSDPVYYAWAGHLTDEGRWTQQARALVLFGELDLDYWLALVHLAVAPLYQAATWVSFSLFGVGLSSARLVSAVSGSLLLLVAWRHLRHRLSGPGLVVTLAILALQHDLVFLSRVAVPEMTTSLFELLAFLVLVSRGRSARGALLAGLVTSVGLGFKGTGFMIVPVFAVIAGVMGGGTSMRARLARAGAYVAPIAVSAIVVTLAAEAWTDLGVLQRIAERWATLEVFLEPASVYAMATFVFYGEHAASLNVLLVGALWVAGLLFVRGALPAGPTRDLYVASSAWIAGWLLVGAVLAYFPERYVFHVLVPLGINLGAGVTLLGASGGRDAVAEAWESDLARRRYAKAVVLSLPLAALVAALILPLAQLWGAQGDSFSLRVLAVSALTLAVAAPAARVRRWERLEVSLLLLPAAVMLTWALAGASGWVDDAFWGGPARGDALRWIGLWAAGGVLIGAWMLLPTTRARWRGSSYLVLAGLVAVSLARSLPPIVRPTYTLSAATAVLEEELAGVELVWTYRAATALLPTTLRFREGVDAAVAPAVVVAAFEPPPVSGPYEEVARFGINLGEAFLRDHDVDPVVVVYRRVR